MQNEKLQMPPPDFAEAEVRAMRDAIYGPGSQAEWDKCKEAWLKDSRWLSEQRQNKETRSGKKPIGNRR